MTHEEYMRRALELSLRGTGRVSPNPLVGAVVNGAGWRAGYLLLGALTVALNLPAILFLPSLDPTQAGFKALGADEQPAAKATDQSSSAASAGKVSVFMLVQRFPFRKLLTLE